MKKIVFVTLFLGACAPSNFDITQEDPWVKTQYIYIYDGDKEQCYATDVVDLKSNADRSNPFKVLAAGRGFKKASESQYRIENICTTKELIAQQRLHGRPVKNVWRRADGMLITP